MLPAKAIQQAARHVRQGGIIAYPTEGVFGLGCDPCNARAVLKLLHIKKRSTDKGLILIAADIDQLKPFVENIPDEARQSWPGPVTWLLPARNNVPRYLRGKHDTIAVRVTAHPIAAALCREIGSALVSTSANLAGQRPATSDRDVRRRFDTKLIYVVPGQTLTPGQPTVIRNAHTGSRIR